jgi:ABC-2 type transport system permease protein
MLADAFNAERLRLSKAYGTLFWSLAFIPIASFLVVTAEHAFFHQMAKKIGQAAALGRSGPMDLAVQAIGALSGAPYILSYPFLLIAATSILASDYRWETWRLLTPRNTRPNLILAKLGLFALVAGAGLLLIVLSSFLSGLFGGLLNKAPLAFASVPDASFGVLSAVFALGWLELVLFGALAACMAVVTRSPLATLFITLGAAIAQALIMSQVQQQLPDPTNPPLQYLALLPGYSADIIKASLQGGLNGPDGSRTPFALAVLLLWTGGLTALSVFLFKRQDLTRE